MHSLFTHLECSECGREHSATELQSVCTSCGRSLLARYDLQTGRNSLDRTAIASRPANLWRYHELLPVFDPRNIVSLGEGFTPLLRLERTGARLGIPDLWLKDEAHNPTGSFKARGLCLAVSRGLENGVTEFVVPTAGNAGGALAAYAAAAGLRCHIYMPDDTPEINIRECVACGADVHLVSGVISDAAKEMNTGKKDGWFDVSTLKEPYRLEGKKTLGFEIAEQLKWELPDVIVYPTGGGTGLIGMWKAFDEMEELGWIGSARPRMVAVQSDGCAPIVKAFESGGKSSEYWENAETIASGLRVPKAFADTLILRAIYESNGSAVAVGDDQILRAIRDVAAESGILLCPEGAATVAALELLRAKGIMNASSRVIVLNTGSGLKYNEVLRHVLPTSRLH